MKLGPLTGDREPGIGWIRLFGYGVHWKDTRRHRLFFSERNGYRRQLRVGPWRLELLFPLLVLCATIADPDQRALCRALEAGRAAECASIADFGLRQSCRARFERKAAPCSAIADQWKREKCRREVLR